MSASAESLYKYCAITLCHEILVFLSTRMQSRVLYSNGGPALVHNSLFGYMGVCGSWFHVGIVGLGVGFLVCFIMGFALWCEAC